MIVSQCNESCDHNTLEFFNLMLQNSAKIGSFSNQRFNLLIKSILDHELAKKDKEIARLKKENEELRHRPGNPGYLEAMEDFENWKKEKK